MSKKQRGGGKPVGTIINECSAIILMCHYLVEEYWYLCTMCSIAFSITKSMSKLGNAYIKKRQYKYVIVGSQQAEVLEQEVVAYFTYTNVLIAWMEMKEVLYQISHEW